VRQPDRAEALAQVGRVLRLRANQLRAQRQDDVFGQHGDAVLGALAVAHDQLAALEVDVLDTQPQPFHQPHARAVQQRSDEPGRAAGLVEQRANLAGRQHDRQAPVVLGADDLVEPRQLQSQRLLVEEEERRLGLVLRGRRDPPIGGQVREEGLDLGRPMSSGCRLPLKRMKRRVQSTYASSVRME